MVQVEPAFEALIDHPSVIEKVRALFGDTFILHSSWNTMVPGTDATGKHPDPNPKTGFHQDGTGSYSFNMMVRRSSSTHLRLGTPSVF